MIKRGKKYCKLSELKVNVGETKLLLDKKITKILNVKTYNLLNYKKHKFCKSILKMSGIFSCLSEIALDNFVFLTIAETSHTSKTIVWFSQTFQ